MDISTLRRLAIEAYDLYGVIFTDQKVITDVISIIDEIKARKYTDAESLYAFTSIGDVRHIRGFWNSELICKLMIDCYQARSMRLCCYNVGMALEDAVSLLVVTQLLDGTDSQRDRLYPSFAKIATSKFGREPVDQDAVLALFRRNDAIFEAMIFGGRPRH